MDTVNNKAMGFKCGFENQCFSRFVGKQFCIYSVSVIQNEIVRAPQGLSHAAYTGQVRFSITL